MKAADSRHNPSSIWLPSRRSVVSMLAASIVPLGATAFAKEPQQTLTVAFSDGAPPYSYLVNGEVVGILPSLLSALLRQRLGWQVEFRAFPWRRAQSNVRRSSCDAFCTYPSAERQQYALFSQVALAKQEIGYIFFSPDNPKAESLANIKSVEDMAKFTMASVIGTDWEAQNIPRKVRRIDVANFEIAYNMVHTSRVDFLVHSPEQIAFREHVLGIQTGLDSVHTNFLYNHLLEYHFGIRRSFPDASAIMAAFDAAQQVFVGSEEYKTLRNAAFTG